MIDVDGQAPGEAVMSPASRTQMSTERCLHWASHDKKGMFFPRSLRATPLPPIYHGFRQWFPSHNN